MRKQKSIREEVEAAYRRALELLRPRREPQDPEDPHSYVTAPKKPRPTQGSAAAAVEPEIVSARCLSFFSKNQLPLTLARID